jgi:dTDP-4-dehydrorhamnose reductase
VKVLVTGSTGQVGRALLAHVPPGVRIVSCSHAELDIASTEAVQEAVRRHWPDLIINAAAHTAVDRAESEPELALRINAEGPRNLAREARACGARLLHISTDFVFDGQSCVPYRPDAPTNPLSVYGRTKRAGEEAVQGLLPERSVILRTAWVYAALGRNFMNTMLRLLREKGAVRVVSDQVGTPTAATSIAQVLWRIAATPPLTGIHHFTDAGVASWYDFAVAIAEEGTSLGLVPGHVTVTPITTAEYPTPARRPHYSVLDGSSLAALGVPPVHWRVRLREALAEVAHG